MRRIATGLLLSFSLISGCASQHISTEDEEKRLQFQQRTLTPKEGLRNIEETELQTGDILLSADDRNLISAGIRLASLSPVSHVAIYIGDGEIVEAVRGGVVSRTASEMRDEESVIAVYRYPNLDDAEREKLRHFARLRVGKRYNFVGVALQAPFMLTRRLCEAPVFPGQVRHNCYQTLGVIQMPPLDPEGMFCSQFVLEIFREADLPLTDSASHWISPDDIMHMREGDVPTFKANRALEYVGHLKARQPRWQNRRMREQPNPES